MNGRIADFPTWNWTWSRPGRGFLMFSIVLSATIPALAQQDDACASFRKAEASLSRSSPGQTLRPCPANLSPSLTPAQPGLALAPAPTFFHTLP